MQIAPKYTCAECGKEIEEGEFIAILGEAPASGVSTPLGRTDKILNDIGKMYCREDLPKVIERDFDFA